MGRRVVLSVGVILVFASFGHSRSGTWTEVLHVADGRFNNAPRLSYNDFSGQLDLTYKGQLGTNSSTRQIAAGSYDGKAWTIADVTTNPSSKEFPDVAFDEFGNTHVVWRENVAPGEWQIRYSNNAGGPWLSPRTLTTGSAIKGRAVIAIEVPIAVPLRGGAPDSVVHVAYSTLEPGITDDEIYYLRYDWAADTSSTLQITNNSVSDDDVQILVLGDFVSLAWIQGPFEGALKFATGNLASGFVEIPTGVNASAAQPDMSWSTNYVGPQIVYRHSVTSSIKTIRYVQRNVINFTTPVDVTPPDAFYSEPSVVATTVPSVAFRSNTTGREGLYVAQWDFNGGFELPEVVHSDPTLTYYETDFEVVPFLVGLPGPQERSGAAAAWIVTSTGYVEADTVRADLRVFEGAIVAVDTPLEAIREESLAISPNPFRASPRISLSLPGRAERVLLDIHDVTGRRLRRVVDREFPQGDHLLAWPRDLRAPGVYFLRLEVDGRTESQRVTQLR